MTKLQLVESLDEVRANIKRFNDDLYHEYDTEVMGLNGFLSTFHQWYYIDDIDLFGPSKFIGYKYMDSHIYQNKHGLHADGRITEKALKSLGFVSTADPSLYIKLELFLNSFGKKPRKGVKINVLNSSAFLLNPTSK
jgi:5-methylcytosine-specific restriction protein A